MRGYEPITLTRDTQAIVIPEGSELTLPEGSEVILTQTLGGDFTVYTPHGFLARIAARDADALGKERPEEPAIEGIAVGEFSEELVWKQLATCYDPEIPVNIVDLGLIYGCQFSELPEGGHRVDVQMTLTAPGCGMGEILKQDVERKIRSLPGVKEVHVELVFEPFWTPARMSEAARLELNMF
jgi:probable FeS assembly SUF system protein SufT